MTLNELKVGHKGIIKSVGGELELRRRLLDMLKKKRGIF